MARSTAALARAVERLRSQHEKFGEKLDALETELDGLLDGDPAEEPTPRRKRDGKSPKRKPADDGEEDEDEDEDDRD